MERRPLKYEEQHRLLLHHSHNLKKPPAYFLDPPPLPPEDLEPPQEKPEEKPPETVVETNKPAEPKPSKSTKRGRRRQPRINTPGPSSYQMGPGPMPNVGFQRHDQLYSSPTGGWYGNNPNQPPNFSGQYPQQLPPGGPKFQVPPHPISQSKMALGQYLRQRQPGNTGFPSSMGPSGNPMESGRPNAMQQRNFMLRNSIVSRQRSQLGAHMRDEMYGQNTGGAMGPASGMAMGPTAMNSQRIGQFNNFGNNMGQQQPMPMETNSTGGGMMNSGGGYNQFNSSGNNMAMPGMAQQGNFINQQQNNPQFSGSSSRFAGGGGMSNMGGGMQPSNMNMGGLGMGGNNMAGGSMTGGNMSSSNMGGYNQMGPQGGKPQANYNMQGMGSTGRMHPLQRQQMMNMHQQQQGGHNPQMQQQQQQQPGPSTNILSQLQRQMSGGGGPQQPQNPHYNNYQSY